MVNNYIQFLKNRGYSPHTVKNYERILNNFSKDFGPINNGTIEQYRESMVGSDQSTINLKLTVLRNYCKFSDCCDYRKIILGKVRYKELPIESVAKIKEAITAEPNETVKVVMELLLTTGMRLSEMTSLKLENLDREREELQIAGKGGKTRVVFIKPELLDKIGLVCNLNHRWVQRAIKQAGDRIGINNLHAHELRHIFATNTLNSDIDIRYVQAMLGHASIMSTQRYTHVTNNKMREMWGKVKF